MRPELELEELELLEEELELLELDEELEPPLMSATSAILLA